MAIPNDQLTQIFQDLQARFENDRYIQVIPFGDTAPEGYEIKYNILSIAQNEDGSIAESREHSILISIPFGFPHFPPNCRPRTSIFHPDFDQAAICIGDFWDKDKTLTDLIIHIGKMISGEIYSTDNAFNEAAVTWYKNNQDKIPFEILSFSPEFESSDDFIDELDESLFEQGIDTLDDDDISSLPDFLSLEKEDEAEDIVPPSSSQPTGNVTTNRVHLMVRQKRYSELASLLSSLPVGEDFEDKSEIEKEVNAILQKTKELQKEADDYEHQGKPKKALELLRQITDLVSDHPNIKENIERTQKSIEIAAGWEEDRVDVETTDQSPEEPTEGKRKTRVAFYEEKSKPLPKIIPIFGIIIAIALAIIILIPLFNAGSVLKKSEAAYSKCITSLSQDKFKLAQNSCNEALAILSNINFFKKKDRAVQQKKIQQTLASEKMSQGLSGKILFQGKYVTKNNVEKVLEFNTKKEEADLLFQQNLWEDASAKYISALSIADPMLESFPEDIIKALYEKNTLAQINILINRGQKLLSESKLDKAKEEFDLALKSAEMLTGENRNTYVSIIEPKLSEIEYLLLLDLGKDYFFSNDWEKAIQQYEKALKLHNESPLVAKHDDVESLYTNMAEAELYSLITNGKEAFSKSRWADAIAQYQKAIELLESKRKLLQRIDPNDVQKQLRRIILRAKIVQHKTEADTKLEKTLFREAIVSFEAVIEVITSSSFSEDKEFSAILSGIRSSIAEARKKATLSERQAYLLQNYKQIFTENYSAAIPEYLSEPKAIFLKYIGEKQLFELQCIEKNRGRQLRLVMQYIYDPAKSQWQFYSEPK